MERRQHERTSRSIRVEMTHPGIGMIVGFTTDISEGGAQVMLENQVLPPVGTVVQVLFRKVVGPINSEPVAMKVVRQFRNTIGLTFAV